jgi:hypothetical protein
MIDKRPLLIARCADAADVIAAVNFGRDNKLPIAIRSGRTQWTRARQRRRRSGHRPLDDEGGARRFGEADGPGWRRLRQRRRRPRNSCLRISGAVWHRLDHRGELPTEIGLGTDDGAVVGLMRVPQGRHGEADRRRIEFDRRGDGCSSSAKLIAWMRREG